MTESRAGDEDSSLPANPEAVCFDLDDTLYPYREYARAGLDAAADRLEARTGLELHDELHRLYFEEGVTEDTFDQLLYRYEVSTDLVDDLVEAFHAATGPLSPYEDADPVLSTLGEGAALGVITDGRNGRAKLERLDLAGHFDAVVVTPTLGTSKRTRRPFEVALESLDASPSGTVYVGDDPGVDFRVPNRLGMGTVRLRRGRYVDRDASVDSSRPDVEIGRLGDLLDVLSAAHDADAN